MQKELTSIEEEQQKQVIKHIEEARPDLENQENEEEEEDRKTE